MFLLATLTAFLALLAPAQATKGKGFSLKQILDSKCSLSRIANPSLPTGQTALAVPSGQKLVALTLGVGVQNYTCSDAGAYAAAGALATMFDVSCYAPIINDLPQVLLSAYKLEPLTIKLLGQSRIRIGDHLFVTNPITNNGTVPKFDFTSKLGAGKFFNGAKAGGVKAPASPENNVDWLQLSHVQGDLANTVFRLHTAGGQPPSSCKTGDRLSVPYAAQYWFFK